MKASDNVDQTGKSVLLVGDSGTHKTYMLGTFPKAYIFDFDRGLSILNTAKVLDYEYDTFKDAPYGSKLTKTPGVYPWGEAWPAFIKKLNEIGDVVEKGKESPYLTLGFDSMTMMSNIAMNYVLKENSRTPTMGPRIQDWGSQMGLMETVIDQVTAWTSFYKVATAHIQRDTNLLSQQVEKLPLLTGKLAGKISMYFDEVYFTDAKLDPNKKQIFFLHTQSDPTMRQAKSRFGVPDGVAADFAAIKKYLEPAG